MGVEPGIKGKSFIVQGFGNVGYWASKFFVEEGAKLVGVAEFDGSIYNENGIDPEQLFQYKKQNRGVANFPDCKTFENEDAIYQHAYYFCNVVTFSSPQLWKNQLTRKMLTDSIQNLLLRQPMDLPLWKLNKLCWLKDINFCLISFVMQEVWQSVISNGWKTLTTSDQAVCWENGKKKQNWTWSTLSPKPQASMRKALIDLCFLRVPLRETSSTEVLKKSCHLPPTKSLLLLSTEKLISGPPLTWTPWTDLKNSILFREYFDLKNRYLEKFVTLNSQM